MFKEIKCNKIELYYICTAQKDDCTYYEEGEDNECKYCMEGQCYSMIAIINKIAITKEGILSIGGGTHVRRS